MASALISHLHNGHVGAGGAFRMNAMTILNIIYSSNATMTKLMSTVKKCPYVITTAPASFAAAAELNCLTERFPFGPLSTTNASSKLMFGPNPNIGVKISLTSDVTISWNFAPTMNAILICSIFPFPTKFLKSVHRETVFSSVL